jgi:8-oxo-dGTP diphosphatase
MTLPHRIAAGGLTFKDDAVLLVRYADGNGGSFLAAPGGGLEDGENIPQAVIRETLEETNISVLPRKVVLIEDLEYPTFKMCKTWMVCEYLDGTIAETKESRTEGILEAGWFTKAQLVVERVYPAQLLQSDWEEFKSDPWSVRCPPSRMVKTDTSSDVA